jgi:hypothetical protein
MRVEDEGMDDAEAYLLGEDLAALESAFEYSG